jgi:hypothetical protein
MYIKPLCFSEVGSTRGLGPCLSAASIVVLGAIMRRQQAAQLMSVWLAINCEGVKGREIEYGCKTVFGFARHYMEG